MTAEVVQSEGDTLIIFNTNWGPSNLQKAVYPSKPFHSWKFCLYLHPPEAWDLVEIFSVFFWRKEIFVSELMFSRHTILWYPNLIYRQLQIWPGPQWVPKLRNPWRGDLCSHRRRRAQLRHQVTKWRWVINQLWGVWRFLMDVSLQVQRQRFRGGAADTSKGTESSCLHIIA